MLSQERAEWTGLLERVIEAEPIEEINRGSAGAAAVEQNQASCTSEKMPHPGTFSGLALSEEAGDAIDPAVAVLAGAVRFFGFFQSVVTRRGAMIASVTIAAVPSSVSPFNGRYRSRTGFQARAIAVFSSSSSSQRSPYRLLRKKNGREAICCTSQSGQPSASWPGARISGTTLSEEIWSGIAAVACSKFSAEDLAVEPTSFFSGSVFRGASSFFFQGRRRRRRGFGFAFGADDEVLLPLPLSYHQLRVRMFAARRHRLFSLSALSPERRLGKGYRPCAAQPGKADRNSADRGKA